MKKIITIFLVLVAVFCFYACNDNPETPNQEVITYTVSFDSNGGTAVSEQTVEQNATAIKPENPVKEGYSFTYWTLNNEEFDWATPITSDITLVAKWQTVIADYIVIFDSQGGSFVESKFVNKGESVSKPIQPEKAGYSFVCWELDGVEYDFNQSVFSDIVLTAKWTVNRYNITLYSNGGNVSDNIIEVVYGESYELPVPTKENSTFKGWKLGTKYFANSGVWEISEDIRLDADYVQYLDFVVNISHNNPVKILQLTDTQVEDPGQARTLTEDKKIYYSDDRLYGKVYKYIDEAIETVQPDLIVVTGDIVFGRYDDTGYHWEKIVNYIDSFDIPWAPIFGNHDNESLIGIDWQIEKLLNAENCLFKRNPDNFDLTGNCNYTVGISQNGKIIKALYMLDSNGVSYQPIEGNRTKAEKGFDLNQMQWLDLVARELDSVLDYDVSKFLVTHIPFAEFYTAAHVAGYQIETVESKDKTNTEIYDISEKTPKNGDFGYKGEEFKGASTVNNGLWTILKNNGFDGVMVGHSHKNSTSILYDGIRLTFGLKTGTEDRYLHGRMGGTQYLLNGSDSFTVSHVYYDLESEDSISSAQLDILQQNNPHITDFVSYGGSVNCGLVEDNTAKTGTALKGIIGTSLDSADGGTKYDTGVRIDFDGVNLTNNEVLISFKNNYYGIYLCVAFDGGSLQSLMYVNSNNDYVSFNINQICENKSITLGNLTSIALCAINNNGNVVMIDEIEIIEFIECNISLELDGGIASMNGENVGSSVTVSTAGANVSSLYSVIDVEKTGYTFLKWLIKVDENEYREITEEDNVIEGLTVKAVYLNAVGSVYNGEGGYEGVVSDNGVRAMKGSSVQSSNNNGLKLTFIEGIDTIRYKVLLDIRAENSSGNTVTMYHNVNGTYISALGGLTNEYGEIDISASCLKYNIRTLTSFDLFAKVATKIYVKGISFVERESSEMFTIKFTNQWNTKTEGISKISDVGTISVGQAVPNGAPTGVSYCLKYYDSGKTGGLIIDFGGLDVSKYSSINVNFGTNNQNWNIGINGAYATWGTGSTNITKDLVAICNNKNITTLNNMYIEKNGTLDTVYLYSIEFVVA